MVRGVGIEPTSRRLQLRAKTTSATRTKLSRPLHVDTGIGSTRSFMPL